MTEPGRTSERRSEDRYRADLVLSPDLPDRLRVFNEAGVLAPADVHAATRWGGLAGETDDEVLLAAALAVRGPRVGHVSVDLLTVHASVVVEEDELDVDVLPWPEPRRWVQRVGASALVAVPRSDVAPPPRPLRLVGGAVYLDRYWRDEAGLAADLLGRCGPGPANGGQPGPLLEADLERLFPGHESSDQRAAAAAAVTRGLTVLCGGPGTGKTTAVARLLALLGEMASGAGRRPPLVALSAPTGKAAARLEEAVRAEAARLPVGDATRRTLTQLSGTTIHRLLGSRPDRRGQFRHHRLHRLPHEVVVVDEASMVSLSLMARLVEAVRPDARLILVGDPDQLVSVEAGAVLADVVGPAQWSAGTRRGVPASSQVPVGEDGGRADSGGGLVASRGAPLPPWPPSPPLPPWPPSPPLPLWPDPTAPANGPMAASISVLRTNHRFSGTLARLSEAVRDGDADTAVRLLGSGEAAVAWDDVETADLRPVRPGPPPAHGRLAGLADATLTWAGEVREAACVGDRTGALAALKRYRVLCAHRRGPAGAAAWNRTIEGWLTSTDASTGDGSWYAGRPILVTANDYASRLFNGDSGVAVSVPSGPGPDDPSTLRVAFDGGPTTRSFSPSRLHAVETVYAMTVHKSQGSEFDHVTLLLPEAGSRLLTRQLLYTALTRARDSVRIIGTEAAIRTAVARPIARASGLGARLWGEVGASS